MTKRIWELDALRGICVIAMVLIHFVYDAVRFFGLFSWDFSPAFQMLMNWGGVIFLVISGICATLGSHCVRRGVIVFGCGMVISAVTVGLYLLNFAPHIIIIYFGVLHCLGVCMMAWHFLKKLPTRALTLLSCVTIALGLWFRSFRVGYDGLFWLGLISDNFESADFFPLLPHLGFFLAGTVIGRTLYRRKQTLFPGADLRSPLIRFCTACGKHSLLIYMLHQPLIALVIWLLGR